MPRKALEERFCKRKCPSQTNGNRKRVPLLHILGKRIRLILPTSFETRKHYLEPKTVPFLPKSCERHLELASGAILSALPKHEITQNLATSFAEGNREGQAGMQSPLSRTSMGSILILNTCAHTTCSGPAASVFFFFQGVHHT